MSTSPPTPPRPPGPCARVVQGQPRLSLEGITKRFGGVRAIRHADLHVMPGEVHALVGENGAGKSTLIKILAGAEVTDAGTITVEGQAVTVRSASDALALGVATVYQEAQLFAQLTVAENVFLGRELRRGRRIDWSAQNAQVVELLERLDLPAAYATRRIETLSAAAQQQVSIAKALAGDARILILDEPSAILTDAEIETLFAAVRRLTEQGVSIIYITHRLDELTRIADVVTVMRDGTTIGTYEMSGLDVRGIAAMMVGDEYAGSAATRERAADSDPSHTRDPVLVVEGLGSGADLHHVDLAVRTGEIVVLYGLVGSGVADIASAIYGMTPITAGTVRLDGEPLRLRGSQQAHRRGIAMLPANRKHEGLFAFQSVGFNIAVGNLSLLRRAGLWMDERRERATALDMIARLAIKTPGPHQAVQNLSGGNAQKVVLARQLVERPRLLLLAEPTQGVDIGAKEEIHKLIDELAAGGTAVLVATSDLTEAMRIGHRLVVIRNGTTFTELERGASQADLLAAAAGQLSSDQERDLAREGQA